MTLEAGFCMPEFPFLFMSYFVLTAELYSRYLLRYFPDVLLFIWEQYSTPCMHDVYFTKELEKIQISESGQPDGGISHLKHGNLLLHIVGWEGLEALT